MLESLFASSPAGLLASAAMVVYALLVLFLRKPRLVDVMVLAPLSLITMFEVLLPENDLPLSKVLLEWLNDTIPEFPLTADAMALAGVVVGVCLFLFTSLLVLRPQRTRGFMRAGLLSEHVVEDALPHRRRERY